MKATLIDPTGQPYVGGCLPRVSKIDDGTFRVFDPGKAEKNLPRRGASMSLDILRPLAYHVIDQKSQGSCCACMGCHAMMFHREVAGLDRIVFSQASLYALGNGGRDEGMAIDTCLKLLMENGACPTTLIDQYDWQGYRRGTWPDEYKTVGKRYRALEAFDVPDIQTAKWGIERGFIFQYGAKGHAVNKITLDTDWNSWGPQWGDGGLGLWATWDEIRRALPMYGGFFLRVATDPDNDGDLPQPKE